jgi:hypothetical protein
VVCCTRYFKMRQTYSPTLATDQLYRAALHNDLGIYNVQTGAGIGGFLKKMMTKYVIPLGKSALHKGYEMAKPELTKLVQKGIDATSNYGTSLVNKGVDKLHKKAGTKRKIDALS